MTGLEPATDWACGPSMSETSPTIAEISPIPRSSPPAKVRILHDMHVNTKATVIENKTSKHDLLPFTNKHPTNPITKIPTPELQNERETLPVAQLDVNRSAKRNTSRNTHLPNFQTTPLFIMRVIAMAENERKNECQKKW